MTGSLAGVVRTLRERALLSQEELAERSGLSVSTIRGMESGRVRKPRGASVRRIMDAIQPSGPDRRRLVDAAYHACVAGETDLRRLLAGLDPQLHEGEFVFVTVPNGQVAPRIEPVMSFAEREGRTLIVPHDWAEAAGLAAAFPCSWITLRIHSSLEAVGLVAAVAAALAKAGISCNMVSAYYHDHLFVPAGRGREAVEMLRQLADAIVDQGHAPGCPRS